MALSVIVIPGDGVTTQFNIPFSLGYIKESDISARVGSEVDGAGNPIYRTLTFLSPEIVEVAGPPAKVGENIVFTRTVDQEQLLVDFEDGDVINEVNMNTAQRQAIMLVHQVLDGRFAQFQSGFDMGGFNITGLGDPVNPQDAATKNYIDSRIATGAENAAIAIAARDASIAARNAAQASQAAAAASASNAAASEVASANSAAAALASRNAAAASQTAAATSAGNANTSAIAAEASNVSAGNSAAGAGTSASAASASAAQALAFRNTAETHKNAAAASASAASTSKTDAQTAQVRAYNWAQAAENTQVNDTVRTGYSAYHWAAKAAASAAAAQTFDPANYYTKTAIDSTYGSMGKRNLFVSTAAPSGGANGDVWYQVV